MTNIIFYTVVLGILGARIYYVLFNFSYYKENLFDIFKIWEGGLAIHGGIIFAGLFLIIYVKKKYIKPFRILDIMAVSLIIAQAIGRWGNFLNQELYGKPTQFPWKIYIEPVNRLIGYGQFSYFHPLFFYEMILMLLFAVGVWLNHYRQLISGYSVGSGKLFLLYVFYYSFIRFWLDFIRIDKAHFFNTNLGLNQVFLIMVMMTISIHYFRQR